MAAKHLQSGNTAATKRCDMPAPNILFIQTDQLSALSLAAYGNPTTVTPNLDRLAETGAVFDTACCNYPLCAPSRASMATGKLCSAIGAYDNAAELPAEQPTYAHYLRRLGYQTALSGKMHFIGPDQFHGLDSRLTADIYPTDFSWVPNWADEGERDTNDPRSVLVSGICKRSLQIDFDENATRQARRYLQDHAASGSNRPFFLQVSYTHPHEPYLCRRRHWDLYARREIPLPRVPALPASRHDPHSVRILRDFGMLDYTFSEEDILRARRAHYGSISFVDEMVGELLETLRETGADGNTAVIFTSDHGEFLGERGMWFKKHFYEPSLRVPLIISAPWIQPQRIQEFVSLVDLLPTFCGLATGSGWTSDIEPLEGTDLTAYLDRPSSPPQRTVAAEYLAEAALAPIFMLRRGRYKCIWSSKDPLMLYDVESDPDELENLAGHPDHTQAESELIAEIARKWDEKNLASQIRDSQRRRRLILEANSIGTPPRWNHGEKSGEDVPWYRGDQGYSEWALDYQPEDAEGSHT